MAQSLSAVVPHHQLTLPLAFPWFLPVRDHHKLPSAGGRLHVLLLCGHPPRVL